MIKARIPNSSLSLSGDMQRGEALCDYRISTDELTQRGIGYILETDADNSIPFATFYPNGKNNVLILPKEQRNRLLNVREINNAKYFLTNFRGDRTSMDNEYPYKKYFSAKIDGVEILVVYKIRD